MFSPEGSEIPNNEVPKYRSHIEYGILKLSARVDHWCRDVSRSYGTSVTSETSKDNFQFRTLFKRDQGFDPMKGEASGGDGIEYFLEGRNGSDTSVEDEDLSLHMLEGNSITSNRHHFLESAQKLTSSLFTHSNSGKRWSEVGSKLINSTFKLGTQILGAALEVAAGLFSDDGKCNEDIVKFNGYTINTSGVGIVLDSMEFYKNRSKFLLRVRVTMALEAIDSQILLEDRKWTLSLIPFGLIEVYVPLGINSAEMTYEGPVNGLIIIESP